MLLDKNQINDENIEGIKGDEKAIEFKNYYFPKKTKPHEFSTFSNCVLLEILLRYSHMKKLENKIWFIDVFQPVNISQLKKEIE